MLQDLALVFHFTPEDLRAMGRDELQFWRELAPLRATGNRLNRGAMR